MDSPTLASYNFEQFYLESRKLSGPIFNEPTLLTTAPTPSTEYESPPPAKRSNKKAKASTSESYKATKNVAKNYGKAISSFASSKLSTSYLTPILQKYNLSMKDFQNYVDIAKKSLQGIDSFRNLLLIKEDDTPEMVAKKLVFQAIGIIFIKYFSVNWIMHGKISNKIVYLKYRFKILRRIQNPASFTYLKYPKVEKEKKQKKKTDL